MWFACIRSLHWIQSMLWRGNFQRKTKRKKSTRLVCIQWTSASFSFSKRTHTLVPSHSIRYPSVERGSTFSTIVHWNVQEVTHRKDHRWSMRVSFPGYSDKDLHSTSQTRCSKQDLLCRQTVVVFLCQVESCRRCWARCSTSSKIQVDLCGERRASLLS